MYQYRDLNFSDQPRPLGQTAPIPTSAASSADLSAVEADVTALEAAVATTSLTRAKGRFLYG